MSLLRRIAKAAVIGAAVAFTGGAAGAALGFSVKSSLTSLAVRGALYGALTTASAYASRPRMDTGPAQARLNATVNPSAFGKWVFGETAMATDVVYQEQLGESRVFYVMQGAAHEIESFGDFFINDEQVTFSGNNATGDYAGVLTRFLRDGSVGQSAIPAPQDSQYPATSNGRGLAHIGLLWDMDSEAGREKLSGGIPTRITQVVKGALCYDPRKDSTRGGSGSHRIDNQGTWEWSANWALIVAHYLYGWRIGDKLIYGVGADDSEINWNQVAQIADVCDQTVDGQPRYHIGGVIELDGNHESVISQLEAAIDGKVSRINGQFYLYAPHNDLATATNQLLTDDDIAASEGVLFSPAGPIEDLYNTARGRYVAPELLFQFNGYAEQIEEQAVTEDGKERLLELDMPYIQSQARAQRIARERIRRSRFTGTLSVLCKATALKWTPFQCITVNLKETNNQNQIFRIVSMSFGISGLVHLSLIEEDASIYDTSEPLGPSLVTFNPLSFNPSQVYTPAQVQAEAITLAGSAGTAKDAIKISWAAPGAFVEDTEVRWRINDPAEEFQYERPKTSTVAILSPVEPLTEYQVQVRHISRTGVESPFVSVTVLTGDDTVNVIRQGQIDDFIPGTDFGITVKSDIAALEGLTGSVDELLERVAQDINEELAIVEANAEIRQVRIDNINKVVELVNEYLEELEGETLPELAARLAVAEDEINNLQVVVIPAINNRLDTAENDLTVLTDSTIPQIQDDLDIAEGTIAAIQGEIFSVTGSVPQTIDDVLETVSQDIAEIYQEIYADRIGANAVTALSIKAGSILSDKIAANAITADKIAANAVTADKITADAINGKTVNGLTINGAVINAGTLNAIDIVGTSKITGATIEGMTINSGEINAVDITAGTITGAEINGGQITGTTIQGAFMGATAITGGTINATDITAGTINGTDIFGVTIEGSTIRATSTSDVSIFGPTISGGEISGTTIIGTDILGGKIFIGGSDDEFSPFRVDENGNMVSTSATIEGEVVSVSGNIGGWEIDNVSLSRSVSGVKLAELNAQTPQLTFRNTSGNVTAQLTPSAFSAGLESSGSYIAWTQAQGLKLSGDIDASTITGSTINGGQLNLTSSGKIIAQRADDNFILWFGDSSISPANRSKSNGDFWIAADGSYRSNARRRSSIGLETMVSTDWTEVTINVPSVKGVLQVTGTLTGLAGADFAVGNVTNLTIEVQLRQGNNVIRSRTLPVPTAGFGFDQTFQIEGTFFNSTASLNRSSATYGDTIQYNLRARLQGSGISSNTAATVEMALIGIEIAEV